MNRTQSCTIDLVLGCAVFGVGTLDDHRARRVARRQCDLCHSLVAAMLDEGLDVVAAPQDLRGAGCSKVLAVREPGSLAALTGIYLVCNKGGWAGTHRWGARQAQAQCACQGRLPCACAGGCSRQQSSSAGASLGSLLDVSGCSGSPFGARTRFKRGPGANSASSYVCVHHHHHRKSEAPG